MKIVWLVEFYLKKKYVIFDWNIEKKEVEGCGLCNFKAVDNTRVTRVRFDILEFKKFRL